MKKHFDVVNDFIESVKEPPNSILGVMCNGEYNPCIDTNLERIQKSV